MVDSIRLSYWRRCQLIHMRCVMGSLRVFHVSIPFMRLTCTEANTIAYRGFGPAHKRRGAHDRNTDPRNVLEE